MEGTEPIGTSQGVLREPDTEVIHNLSSKILGKNPLHDGSQVPRHLAAALPAPPGPSQDLLTPLVAEIMALLTLSLHRVNARSLPVEIPLYISSGDVAWIGKLKESTCAWVITPRNIHDLRRD